MATLDVEDEEQERRTWPDLPQDIVQLILEKLYMVDRIRFGGVCKNWFLSNQVQLDQPIDNKLPWIMNFRFTETDRVCMLFEPFYRHPYIIVDKIKAIRREEFHHARARASRSGWVLFYGGRSCLTHSYYLYNVLTGKVIKLPDLNLPIISPNNLAAFSSVPTSPDCVIFVPLLSYGNQVHICTYSVGGGGGGGDESWKTHLFSCPNGWIYSAEGVVYMDGSFYCLGRAGLLSSFDIATEEWKPLTTIMWEMPYPWSTGRYFLEYGGRLILAFMDMSINSRHMCATFRFDWTDRVWVKMESLEGGALFLGSRNVCLGLPAGENTKMIANRVYYFIGYSRPTFVTCGPTVSRSEQRKDYTDVIGSQNVVNLMDHMFLCIYMIFYHFHPKPSDEHVLGLNLKGPINEHIIHTY